MAYNKAGAEKAWIQWKEAEEQRMRQAGVDEEVIQQLLYEIENEELYLALLTVDKLTLQIVLYKMEGYSPHESAKLLQLSDKAVYRRMDRLKEKIKKLL